MRKIFTAAVFGIVLGVAQMAFSATLVDVPSGHWAEDAVSRLIDLGLVKGYPDGTFKGDRQLTRYEYAMVVDRLVTMLDERYCQKDACKGGGSAVSGLSEEDLNEVKDIVKKLAAEFKDELAALKVKVDENSAKIAKLEEDVKSSRIGNVKVEVSVRQRLDAPSTDLPNGTFSNVYFNKLYNPLAAPGTGPTDVTSGYEMVPAIVFSGKAGDNIDFSIGLQNHLTTSPIYNVANDDDLQIDHAYADINFSDTVRELDLLKVKSGYQSFSFGPYGMLVDNTGMISNAGVRLDVVKDVVSLTGVAAMASLNGINTGITGITANDRDPYAAIRLGLDLPWLDLGANFLANGVGSEKGWGVDVVLPLLKNTPFLNELRGEYMTLTDLVTGASVAANQDDASFILGLDIYKNKRAGLTLSYADLPATVALSSMDGDPFSEYGRNCPIGLDIAPAGGCFSFESGRNLFPAGFEGLGVQASYIVFNDVTLAARGYIGNYAGSPLFGTAADLDGNDFPGFGALSVSKPINDKSTFRVEYAQQGKDPILLNRVRGELLINF